MTPLLVILCMLGYFALLFALSYLSGRKADNDAFFVGSRKSSWYMVAFAMIGSSISGVTFVSVPGMVEASGFSYLQMVMGFVLGQFIIAFVLIPLFYKLNLLSIYEYLSQRFGPRTYMSGAWFFFISKILGAAVRLFLVCLILQMLVFDPLGLPLLLNISLTMLIVWLYTFQGGVKTLIWTDSFKTLCLLLSLILCIFFIADNLDYGPIEMLRNIAKSEQSRVFFFDDFRSKQYFFKLFLAGVFTMIATNGLDQDMMQRNLSCKNFRDSQKNMISSAIMQFFVIGLFLMLGVLLYLYADYAASKGLVLPTKSDELFPFIATQGNLPIVVGIFFIIGLIASAFSAAGSALTALTTSFCIDILKLPKESDAKSISKRKQVHFAMACAMGLLIYLIAIVNETSVINAVYVLASYTYGPILGLFVFGLFCRRAVRDRFVPIAVLLAPALCFVLDRYSQRWFDGYQFSYELLLFNALFTVIGLALLSYRKEKLV